MKTSKSIQELENKEWFEATKLQFLEVMKVACNHRKNPAMQEPLKELIQNYKNFMLKYDKK